MRKKGEGGCRSVSAWAESGGWCRCSRIRHTIFLARSHKTGIERKLRKILDPYREALAENSIDKDVCDIYFRGWQGLCQDEGLGRGSNASMRRSFQRTRMIAARRPELEPSNFLAG
jgi:hypothetical protein